MIGLPSWLEKLMRLICPQQYYEQIEGDLIELYNHEVNTIGKRRARFNLIIKVIRFIRPGIILRNKFRSNPPDFWVSQIRFAGRILVKEKFFSVLNILGLTSGLTIAIVLFLILRHDFTHDRHYSNHEKIFRLGAHYKISGTDELTGFTARELAPILTEHYPEIEKLTRVAPFDRVLVRREHQTERSQFFEDNVVQTDSNYFNVFHHEFVAGDPSTCISAPGNVVITETLAIKYFGTEEALDQVLTIDGQMMKVTGVIRDIPANTHHHFNMMMSGLDEIRPGWDTTVKDGKPVALLFWNPDVFTYLVLPEGYDLTQFYSRFQRIYDQYFKDSEEGLTGTNTPLLQPLAAMHLSGWSDGLEGGNRTHLMVVTSICAMIILLACINYVNLATARAIKRAREIAIRKVNGSSRRLLASSLLCESMLLALAALIFAWTISFFILESTAVKELIQRELSFDLMHDQLLVVASLVLTLSIGLLSGFYPALYLSSIPAVSAIKGNFTHNSSKSRFRQMLVTFQFCVSIFIVACAVFMINQIDFMKSKELGFDNENMLLIRVHDKAEHDNLSLVEVDLLKEPQVKSITSSATVMGSNIGGNVMLVETTTGMREQGGILGHFVGDNYLQTMGIDLLYGRDFQAGEGIDEDGMYIANEAAVKLMGWGENALGKKVAFFGNQNPGAVIGVVKDFHASSLHTAQEPMFIVKGHWRRGYQHVKLIGDDLPAAVARIEKIWSAINPDYPFESSFLDQKFNDQYKAEMIQSRLLKLLSGVCIFISLLGVIGLSAFNASQRTKEIGLRKVLGASERNIVWLLSARMVFLMIGAGVLILPCVLFAMNKWLQNFAYQSEFQFVDYFTTTIAGIGLVMLTTLLQSLRVITGNPVDSLK